MNRVKGKVTIKIPKPLYENLKEVIVETGFNSVTEFIVYVLRDIASGKSSKKDREGPTKEEIVDKNSLWNELNMQKKWVVCQKRKSQDMGGFVKTSCEDRDKELSKWD
jgi:hypothetical protein